MESVQLAVLFAIVAVVLTLILRRSKRRNYRLPPVPKDSALDTWKRTKAKRYEFFTELADQLGNIFYLPLFWRKIVLINDYDTIKEAFSSDFFTIRGCNPFYVDTSRGKRGVLFSSGELWRDHRRFALSVLRDFGFGRNKIEKTIQDELGEMRKMLLATQGHPFSPHHTFVKCVSNVINSLVFNERCAEDPAFDDLIDALKDAAGSAPPSFALYFFWPILKYIPGDFSNLKRMRRSHQVLEDYSWRKYKEHKATYDPNNIRDYIDAYIQHVDSGIESGSDFSELQLIVVISDLYTAGTETTATTLMWAVSFLAKHPEVQRKMQQEIDCTIGDKVPETSDRQKMPYVDASIHEIQRYSVLIPLTGHDPTEETQLCGYEIPMDTMVVANIWSVLRDKRIWRDPYNFNPQNFLDEYGNVINTKYNISFGIGKRQCLGDTLAKQEIFIFLVGMLQQYDFVADSNYPLPDTDDCDYGALVRIPHPFKLIARLRHSD